MGILQDIQERVNEIAVARDLNPDRAFAYWFLEDVEEFSEEEALTLVTDGAWDGGRDAVYHDEDQRELRIYQFKWSQDAAYVAGAFTDIQRAAITETSRIGDVDVVRFLVVTTATATDDLEALASTAQRNLRGWVTRNALGATASVEFFDLRKFAQLFEKIYGVDLALDFMQAPLQAGGAILGLINAKGLAAYSDREELLAFNIRAYLGKRKGSVNADIAESLTDEATRPYFWMLNNGLVCLTTLAEAESATTFSFKNLTIVNGAQTSSTIAAHVEQHPADTEPVWVAAKIITVDEADIDRARLLTKTSNTQTPASNKDLRAVDISHRRIATWMQSRYGITYIYRRGVRAGAAANTVTMKDLAQAYVAFELEQPNIPFARVGSIFSDSTLYNKVIEPDLVDLIRQLGTEVDERNYVAARLLPVQVVRGIRTFIDSRVAAGEDPKWRSATYHLAWVYRKMLEMDDLREPTALLEDAHLLVEATIADVYRAFKQAATYGGLDIPRDLKSTKMVEHLLDVRFVEVDDGVRDARTTIEALLEVQSEGA